MLFWAIKFDFTFRLAFTMPDGESFEKLVNGTISWQKIL